MKLIFWFQTFFFVFSKFPRYFIMINSRRFTIFDTFFNQAVIFKNFQIKLWKDKKKTGLNKGIKNTQVLWGGQAFWTAHFGRGGGEGEEFKNPEKFWIFLWTVPLKNVYISRKNTVLIKNLEKYWYECYKTFLQTPIYH